MPYRMAVGAASVLAILMGCGDVGSSPALRLLDLEGRTVVPLQKDDPLATVFLFTRTDCPISNRFAPEVRRLYEKFSPKQVAFWLVYPNPDESADAIRQHLQDFQYPCQALRDPQHSLVQLTGAKVTPEVAVFVPKREMVYRGRINNRFVDYGKARPKATEDDLEVVLEAIIAGESISQRTTQAIGCPISDLQ